jgi:hypothetical protein
VPLLGRPLGVVARIRLVRGEVDEERDGDREVDVDLDAAMEPALVPIERDPRDVGDGLIRDRFLGRHRGDLVGARTEHLPQPLECVEELAPRHGVLGVPRDVALTDVAGSRKDGVQPLVDLLEDARLGPGRTQAETPLDLVGPGHLGPCESGREALHRAQLRTQPPLPVLLERGIIERVDHGQGVVVQLPRIDELLGGDGSLPLGGADVRVDEVLHMPPHPKAEPDVAFPDVQRSFLPEAWIAARSQATHRRGRRDTSHDHRSRRGSR